jgi:hypothetical protein
MTTLNSYYFNNMGGLGDDVTDQTQRNLQNVKFGNYMVSNYYRESVTNDQIQFASSQPAMMLNADNGIASSVIDAYSNLLMGGEERPLDKLQLLQRPFLTVPYLGRGSCDPTLESQLQQGEIVSDRKSVATVSETTYMDIGDYPLQGDLKARLNPNNMIQESALNGWIRGGASTRD